MNATVAKVELGSFPQPGVAVVFGAGGGVGGALVEAIRAAERFEHVVALNRSTSPPIDLLDEASLERAAAFAADRGELRLVIDATGFLHDDRQGPEKSWRQLDAVKLARSFALNAIGPALIMKHVLPRLARSRNAVSMRFASPCITAQSPLGAEGVACFLETGRLSADGLTITWSDGVIWKRHGPEPK